MALKAKLVENAFGILKASADAVPANGAEYKRLGAATLAAKGGLTIAAAKTRAGLSDRVRMVETALTSLAAANNRDWSVDGLPGTTHDTIGETWDTGIAKAASVRAESVLSAILS